MPVAVIGKWQISFTHKLNMSSNIGTLSFCEEILSSSNNEERRGNRFILFRNFHPIEHGLVDTSTIEKFTLRNKHRTAGI